MYARKCMYLIKNLRQPKVMRGYKLRCSVSCSCNAKIEATWRQNWCLRLHALISWHNVLTNQTVNWADALDTSMPLQPSFAKPT